MDTDKRQQIEIALKKFSNSDLRTASVGLLNTLGYQSEKTIDIDGSPKVFLNQFDSNSEQPFRKDKALFDDWKEIHLLFQITDEELSEQHSIFSGKQINQGLMNSYLFFSIGLKEKSYARGKLSQITRQLNRLFPMPVMVFFEYDGKLSIAVINRRRSKRDVEKDVLGKVTLIQEISLASPHRGHLDILASFSISELKKKKTVNSFDTLHAVWEEIFNVKLLNKRFYRELSNWYFWAMRNVRFPHLDDEMDKYSTIQNKERVREHDAKNLIRLLTRILFVWFIKEKNLIPEELFEPCYLESKLLKKFQTEGKDTQFYKAILQNLFFATLNQTQSKREFRKQGQHHNTTTLLRYEAAFKNPNVYIELVEAVTPFLNGGLFECLDYPHPVKTGPKGGRITVYEDGFSDRKDNPLLVPDFLFFGSEQMVNLSAEFGDVKRKQERVRGLIHILNGYKFTIIENTPIEQEIALDPELLGQVFENLLASYNEETKTTARKQTGSFYTPRTIVEYMVDEALKALLKQALIAEAKMNEDDAEAGLDLLFTYTEREHPFNDLEKNILIKAIDDCKIIDPACGSGAFPMGILQKLVYILGKLDPRDELWENRQLAKVDVTIEAAAKIDESSVREKAIKELEAQKLDIAEAFENNQLGYGRKLYLIENCIYGVDIQSIATQVSKLRFFISLVVDQKVDRQRENFGVRPLPNLETKFVTANTLIHIKKPDAQGELFEVAEVSTLQNELRRVRHDIFSAKTPSTKNKHRNRDKELREAISEELKDNGWTNDAADKLAGWDPYDQNASASYFDPEWMFGQASFDIVIGNPPYIQIQKFSGKPEQKDWQNQYYKTFVKTGDIYSLFYEKGNMVLRNGGILAYITSNKWMRANYGKATRKYFAENTRPIQLIDFGGYKIFESATVDTNILIFEKAANTEGCLKACAVGKNFTAQTDITEYVNNNNVYLEILSAESWIISSKQEFAIKQRIEEIGTPLKEWDVSINYGIKTGFNEAFIIDGAKKDELIAEDPKSAEIIKPVLRGRDIKRYKAEFADKWLIFIPWHFPLHEDSNISGNSTKAEKSFQEIYPFIYNHLLQYKEQLSKRNKAETGIRYEWYALQRCAASYLQEFEKEKIVWKRIGSVIRFSYSTDRELCLDSTVMAIGKYVKYLTALLNSRIHIKTLIDNSPKTGTGDVIISVQALEPLFVYKPTQKQQLPFEILVDCILYAKEHELTTEANTFESVIDGMVFDLYFEEEMKQAHCYITDRVSEVIKPFKANDSDEFKTEYIKKLHIFFRNDKTVFHGLIHRSYIKVVEIINGD